MNAVSDMLLGKGENSREIMINSWSERWWLILLLLGIILLYIYRTNMMYNQRESIIDIFRNMWTVPVLRNYLIYVTLIGLIGYFYPLERNTWVMLAIITFVYGLYVTFSIVH